MKIFGFTASIRNPNMALFLNHFINQITETLVTGTPEEIETMVETTNTHTLIRGLDLPSDFNTALALAREIFQFVDQNETLPAQGKLRDVHREFEVPQVPDVIYESRIYDNGSFRVVVRNTEFDPVCLGGDPAFVSYDQSNESLTLTYLGYSAHYTPQDFWIVHIHDANFEGSISFTGAALGESFVLEREFPDPITITSSDQGLTIDQPEIGLVDDPISIR